VFQIKKNGGYLRHSLCAVTTFKIFLIAPLKATIFVTNSHLLNEQKCYPLPPTLDHGGSPQISGISLWHAAGHKKKPVCTFLNATHVREQAGSENLAVLLSL
jgi:hypothetical protein